MNFYREFILTTLEIALAVFIIIFGYAIWDNFDLTDYHTAKYYDNVEQYEVFLEDNDKSISLLSNENTTEYTKLYLHNISDKNNNTLLTLKVDKENTLLINNTIIKIDNEFYEINKLDYKEDDNYLYFIIGNLDFNGYETKEYNVKVLIKENNDINEYLDYDFTTYA